MLRTKLYGVLQCLGVLGEVGLILFVNAVPLNCVSYASQG